MAGYLSTFAIRRLARAPVEAFQYLCMESAVVKNIYFFSWKKNIAQSRGYRKILHISRVSRELQFPGNLKWHLVKKKKQKKTEKQVCFSYQDSPLRESF